jgi:hypothetical protein
MSATADLDSTLIRRGTEATTISELSAFVATIEKRPLDRLLDELPSLALMTNSKFDLARAVLRRRARDLAPIDREQLRVHAEEVADRAADLHKDDVAVRIRSLFN